MDARWSSRSAACWLVALAGCVVGGPEPKVVRLDSLPEAAEITSAPERVEIVSRELALETYLWRDFMPVSPPDGKPLIALVTVTTVDQDPFPADVDADRLYVICGEEVWIAGLRDESLPDTNPYQLQRIARDGPKWGPGVAVDVVVRICSGGETWLLCARDQPIHRTD